MPDDRPRRPRTILTVLVAGGALLLATGIAGAVVTGAGAHSGPRDMDGRPVVLDPGSVAAPSSPTDDPAATAAPRTTERFAVPSVGLDVPLAILSAKGGDITPPGFTEAYAVANLGVPVERSDAGTVFVVTHSLRRGGRAPGNYLFDRATGASAVAPGSRIRVGGVEYTTTGSRVVPKSRLADDAAVWANTPGRLVVITCLQVPRGTPSVDNFVITAERTDGAS
ncbi:MAG: class F sortase [Williamsia herbipolensis]|nr:class F sortase [Williamsia herbipolensis]